MHIVFAGGGTAGHINPAIAVAGYFEYMAGRRANSALNASALDSI